MPAKVILTERQGVREVAAIAVFQLHIVSTEHCRHSDCSDLYCVSYSQLQSTTCLVQPIAKHHLPIMQLRSSQTGEALGYLWRVADVLAGKQGFAARNIATELREALSAEVKKDLALLMQPKKNTAPRVDRCALPFVVFYQRGEAVTLMDFAPATIVQQCTDVAIRFLQHFVVLSMGCKVRKAGTDALLVDVTVSIYWSACRAGSCLRWTGCRRFGRRRRPP